MESKSLILLLCIGLPKFKQIKTLVGIYLLSSQFSKINWRFWIKIWGPLITCLLIGTLRANSIKTALLGHPYLGCGLIDWIIISVLMSGPILTAEEPIQMGGILSLIIKLLGLNFGHPGEEAIYFFLVGFAQKSYWLQGSFWIVGAVFGNRSVLLGIILCLLIDEKIKLKWKILLWITVVSVATMTTIIRLENNFGLLTGRWIVWDRAIRAIDWLGLGIHNPIFSGLKKMRTASVHNVFLDVAYGGGWLGLISFLWVLWNYRSIKLVPMVATLFGWYFCSSNFWLFWFMSKQQTIIKHNT